MTYRAAVIGCGRAGCAFDDDPRRREVSSHAGAYTAAARIELVALVDIDEHRLEHYGDKFEIRGRYTDHRRMLSAECPDIVSICTWSDTHRLLVEDAANAGVRAVFCEKPIADSLAAARAMIDRCTDNGVLLFVDHQR